MWREIQGFFIVFIGLVFFISCSSEDSKNSEPLSNIDSKNTNFLNNNLDNIESNKTQDSNISNILAEYKTPSDIESFAKKYAEFKGLDSQKDVKIDSKNDKNQESSKNPNLEISKVTQDLDKEFLFLREKYKDNENALNDLKKCCGCIKPDCSALQINNEYFYATSDILEAFTSSILDKNTQILSNVEVLQDYDYVLKSKQTTTIDLIALNPQNSEFSYIKFEWLNSQDSIESSPNTLRITLSPKENICAPQQYNVISTFSQIKGVRENEIKNKNTESSEDSKPLDSINSTSRKQKKLDSIESSDKVMDTFLTAQPSKFYGVKTTQYKEKLPTFLYPADLVYFVRQSCACAMSLGNIANLSNEVVSNVEISEFKLDSKMLDSNAMSFESNIEKSSKNPNLENFKVPKDYYKFLPANIKYCDDLESKRASFWEKYMQDSRVIKILQNEQKMYKQEFQNDEDLDTKNSKDSNNLQDSKDSKKVIESKSEDSKKDSKNSKTPKDSTESKSKDSIESNLSIKLKSNFSVMLSDSETSTFFLLDFIESKSKDSKTFIESNISKG
ncbi:hypothetical protein DCO58_04755 [Helicobacter saguini]|uniref:Lipoprotein n=1 Tax=Helicobacter saguini TaxID=1548018 RepID=A0A347VSW3_9HELI|nr:hypothetical protein [Helicobacter saguini]MWV62339.1 hypothetical protein [Helicobacter saguini]MWV66990.1 hypothetical protein [Helicobacter saguini]MWV69338.1 hypothetical protein [Helicobacter saguini]MWV71107.1 hypothetical protein [Helicobacter saguini]TLD94997.1 hypothetical protein LS64_003520 [Helicobacter saguini]